LGITVLQHLFQPGYKTLLHRLIDGHRQNEFESIFMIKDLP